MEVYKESSGFPRILSIPVPSVRKLQIISPQFCIKGVYLIMNDQILQLLASQNKLLETQNVLLKRIADAVAPDTESALSIAKRTADALGIA